MRDEYSKDSELEQKLEERKNIVNPRLVSNQMRFYIIVIALSALSVIFSIYFRMPIYIPTPWITAVLYLYFAPIFLYSMSVLFRPSTVLAICIPCSILGEILWDLLYGSGGELLLNVVLAVSVWGLGCMFTSLLRNRGYALAMVIGGSWGVFGRLIPTVVYYNLILNWNVFYIIAYSLLSTIFSLVLIPAALILSYTITKWLKVQNLNMLRKKELPLG